MDVIVAPATPGFGRQAGDRHDPIVFAASPI
jgi:hypothetical protein